MTLVYRDTFVSILYPGIVKNVDKAMETLGGVNEVSKVVMERARRLELRFRPNDRFCKPAYGDRTANNGMLLRLVINKNTDSGKPALVHTEVLGVTRMVFQFKGMADFQYLPMEIGPAGKIRDITEDFIPSKIEHDELTKWVNTPCDYVILPGSFSRIDLMSSTPYMYKSEGKEGPGTLIGRVRAQRAGYGVYISFEHDKVPDKPKERAVKYLEKKFMAIDKSDKLTVIKQKFSERPVWSKIALTCVTQLDPDIIKCILPTIAYYFATGPYRTLWVKFGYDPRKDPKSRVYQTLDYRIRTSVGVMNLIKAKRSFFHYLFPNKKENLRSDPSRVSVISKEHLADQGQYELGPAVKDAYIFAEDTIPPARQMFYQYCDIKIPEVQMMLAQLPLPPPGAACDQKLGWLPSGFDTQIRNIINDVVKRNLEKKYKAKIDERTYEDEDEDDVEEDDLSDGEQNEWQEDIDDEDIDETDFEIV